MSLGVGISCGGREDLLRDCLLSIERSRQLSDTRVFVVTDGDWELSSDIVQLIERLGGVLRSHTEQLGIATTWNDLIGLQMEAGIDFVGVFNDDICLPFGFDKTLVDFLAKNPDKECVCVLDRMTSSFLLPDLAPNPDLDRKPWSRPIPDDIDWYYPGGFESFAAKFAALPNDKAWAPCSFNGAGFFLSRRAIEQVGLFDTRYEPPGTQEDVDYWARLLLEYGPYRIGTLTRVFMHHYRGSTIGMMPRSDTQIAVDRNQRRFWEKWGSKKEIVEWMYRCNDTPIGTPLPPR